MATPHAVEVERGERFSFGENWATFLRELNEQRMEQARQSLQDRLGLKDLAGKTLLDAGSGSGLFSLAARQLGAKVHAFDYDPQSVACTRALKGRFFPNDSDWTIDEGSVLDREYLRRLGQFDVVYSWGVLHHTGDLWQALENILPLVAPEGRLFVAIYNDQGRASKIWLQVKSAYNRAPRWLKPLILALCAIRLWGPTMLRDLLRLQPFKTWRAYSRERGMSPWRDVVDWVGGFPFEVAKPAQVLEFCYARGFELASQKTCGKGLGCNEFVFRKP
jgi:2-polyprenyl-6-hydroxyphenyl methylase/3-demethylubiquinone-9 3-methyltransferase